MLTGSVSVSPKLGSLPKPTCGLSCDRLNKYIQVCANNATTSCGSSDRSDFWQSSHSGHGSYPQVTEVCSAALRDHTLLARSAPWASCWQNCSDDSHLARFSKFAAFAFPVPVAGNVATGTCGLAPVTTELQ